MAKDFNNSAVGQGLQRGWDQAVDIANDFYKRGSGLLFNTLSPVKIIHDGVPLNAPNKFDYITNQKCI